ncbi:PREDICTED: fibulin-1-like isoform X2 [Nicrophorus vespilloides]|uniref:Fibulin-1-like isoform X2 n=1 Tax=Nicrophorus vespilloides TaxID=110193 RepID=A0ABM1N9Y3_NICVS|nr:PREDICTED: fibulin-1-like isoform X2 [Nicrophorus vespilloides]
MEYRYFLLTLVMCASTTVGFDVKILTNCCEMGNKAADDSMECSFQAPIPNIKKDMEALCLGTMGTCCQKRLKESECKAGLEDAKKGSCNSFKPERKACCNACYYGKITGKSGGSCVNFMGLSDPLDKYYDNCCKEALNKATTIKPKSSENIVDEGLEDICDIGQVCAQICTPTKTSYKCDCNEGYTLMADGMSCKELKKSLNSKNNRCEKHNPCQHNCTDTGTSIICTCQVGYMLAKDQTSCKDIDECALSLHDCHQNETCINGDGYYECEDLGDDSIDEIPDCDVGYKYNWEKMECEDIDECTIPLICDNSQTCINSIGSYKCQTVCPKGFIYKASIQTCADVDECITGANDCNRESQICLNNKGSYACIDKASKTTCPPGFKMNMATQTCEDVDECIEDFVECSDGEVCINEEGGYSCQPNPAFSHRTTYYEQPTIKFTTVRTTVRTTTPKATTRTTTTKATTTTTTTPKPTTTTTTTTTPKPTTTTTTTTTTPKPTTTTTTTPKPTTTTTTTPKPTTTTTTTTTPKPTTTTRRTTTSTTRKPIYTFNPKLYHTIEPSIPAFRKPNSPTTCSKGFKYEYHTKQCIDIDECVEDVLACDKLQDCFNTIGSYECRCQLGYTRDQSTGSCVDINECQLDAYDCSEGQRCDNTIGSYLCSRIAGCGTGYTFNYASGDCEDDDECALGTHTCDRLGPNFKCRNIAGSFRCERIRRISVYIPNRRQPTNYTIVSGQTTKCLQGYYMDSAGRCQDINECESNPCKKGQNCINQRGRFECVSNIHCRGGYELNEEGNKCIDINECIRGTHSCSSTQICKNYPGYHVCSCPIGYRLDNNQCIDINECEYHPCSRYSDCHNTVGSFKCICKNGFRELDGKCDDIDECSETPSLCHQNCVNNWGGYRCSCNSGFTLNKDNRTCTDVNECEKFKDNNLCVGNCENIPGSYVCRCPPGYRLGTDGRLCLDIDECLSNPCHGVDTICFNTRGGYECPSIACPPNYIRDPNQRSRCKRNTDLCNYAGNCMSMPEQYSFHFITMSSNLPLTDGQTKFFQIKGPSFSSSSSTFNFKLQRVICPSHVQPASIHHFRLTREPQKATISFLRPLDGPQEIELEIEMQLYRYGKYTGNMISRIFIFVTKYRF